MPKHAPLETRSYALEQATRLLQFGIDLENRKMIMGVAYMEYSTAGEVDFPLVANFLSGFHILENMYEPLNGRPQKNRITLEFTSYGGDLEQALGIYDRIRCCKIPVDMYVYGPCYSGGSLILQAATVRYIARHTRLMIHYGYTSDEGTSVPARMREVLVHHDGLMDDLLKIYKSRCSEELTEEVLQSALEVDQHIDAQSCITYGLADHIIGDDS